MKKVEKANKAVYTPGIFFLGDTSSSVKEQRRTKEERFT
jgi:hypothetical protein